MTNCLCLIILILTFNGFSQSANAEIDIETTQPLEVPVKEVSNEIITSKDIENIIPMDLQATNNMGVVAACVVDRGIQAWFNSAQVQESVFGHIATTVQRKLASDITIASSTEPQAIQHKLSLSFMAFQAAAKLQYTGLLKAVFNYDTRAARGVLELSEKFFNKDFFLNHSSSSAENISSIGVKWGW